MSTRKVINDLILIQAEEQQPHVRVLSCKLEENLVNNSDVVINCTNHGVNTVKFSTIKARNLLCTKCQNRRVGCRRKHKYPVGSLVQYNDGRSYTIISRNTVKVTLLSNVYPDRSTFEVYTCYLPKGNFNCPVTPSREDSPHYRGVGIYDSSKDKSAHSRWYKMFQRCYFPQPNSHNSVNYKDCQVCEEWWDFQNYAKWYYVNIKTSEDLVHVDKDILFKGCKLYSPNTCCIIPSELNILFTKRQNYRGDYPIGIYYKTKNKKFCVQCSDGNKSKQQTYLGLFDKIEDAFMVYKEFKEAVVKQKAVEYKEVISSLVYEVLFNYKVELGD